MTAVEISTYYIESFNFLQARKKRQVGQLTLLSNLRRGDENISSTLMLTLFDRMMAGMYDDKIQVKFLPSQGITQEQLNSYDMLAQSDYQEMDKAKIDYDWAWDTLFFGRGYVETIRFDMKKKILQPHVINPLNFGYDPYFDNVQDWRYYWKWITKTKSDLIKLKDGGLLASDFDIKNIAPGIDPYLWQYKVKRDEAREGVAPPMEPYGSDVYQILEFYAHNDDGDKCVYWTDKNFSKIIYESELDLKDGDEIIMPDGGSVSTGSKWPIVVKEAFRIPHSSIPVSVADLLEDKHRAKSVLLNLAYIAAKDQANPIYGYNPDKVRDVTQFLNRQINQHIPMDDEASSWPINKAQTMSPELMSFIQTMDAEAENPVGAGRPMGSQTGSSKSTATMAAINQQLNDLAQSLQSKVMQFGEAEFWSHWFHRYALHADELDTKMANIVGVKGVSSTEIDLNDFNTEFPPGVMIYSAKEAENKELVLRRDLMQLYPDLAQTLDPDGLRNFNKYVFFPKFLQDPSLVDIMLPKTIDEIKADGENEQLGKDKMPDVAPTDNHTTHIYIHHQVMPKNWATWMHIEWHQELLAQQQAQAQQQGGQGSQGGGNKVSESISYKDLPPEGQVQMAQQAGIKISEPAPQAAVANPTKPATKSPQKPAQQSAGATRLGSTAPLKNAMNKNLAGNLAK